MKTFHLKTAHFNDTIDEDCLDSGDFCDPEVEDIHALAVDQTITFDNGLTTVTRLS